MATQTRMDLISIAAAAPTTASGVVVNTKTGNGETASLAHFNTSVFVQIELTRYSVLVSEF